METRNTSPTSVPLCRTRMNLPLGVRKQRGDWSCLGFYLALRGRSGLKPSWIHVDRTPSSASGAAPNTPNRGSCCELWVICSRAEPASLSTHSGVCSSLGRCTSCPVLSDTTPGGWMMSAASIDPQVSSDGGSLTLAYRCDSKTVTAMPAS